jgi:hypothetical protein
MAKAKKEQKPQLRLEWRDAEELAENPANWRKHPESQMSWLADAISECGWAGACLYNERTKRLIDGHARHDLFMGKGKIPVLIGSWDEATEKKILATLDPLAGMAEPDQAKLDELLREIDTGSPALMEMLEKLAEDNGIVPPDEPQAPDDFGSIDENIETEHECPKCGYKWSGGK